MLYSPFQKRLNVQNAKKCKCRNVKSANVQNPLWEVCEVSGARLSVGGMWKSKQIILRRGRSGGNGLLIVPQSTNCRLRSLDFSKFLQVCKNPAGEVFVKFLAVDWVWKCKHPSRDAQEMDSWLSPQSTNCGSPPLGTACKKFLSNSGKFHAV